MNNKFFPLLLCVFVTFSLTNTQDTPVTTANPTAPTTTTTPTTTTAPTANPTAPTTPTTPSPPPTSTTPSLCDLSFFGTPPAPACSIITDADGLQQYDCSIQDSTPTRTSLTKTIKALNVAEGSFYEMDFNGASCNLCTLYVFNKPNFAGAFVAYPFTRAKYNMLLSFKVWRVPFTSFKVICR